MKIHGFMLSQFSPKYTSKRRNSSFSSFSESKAEISSISINKVQLQVLFRAFLIVSCKAPGISFPSKTSTSTNLKSRNIIIISIFTPILHKLNSFPRKISLWRSRSVTSPIYPWIKSIKPRWVPSSMFSA